jgi:hypothetical protein
MRSMLMVHVDSRACIPTHTSSLPPSATLLFPPPLLLRKRKAKKYIVTGSVLRPTTASICQAFTVRQASRIGFMRVDALAVMLSLANVGPHARVLALDMCGGMAAGAVTERLGAYGSLMLLRMGDKPPSLDAWRHYNFSAEEKAVLKVASIEELQASTSSTPDDLDVPIGGSSSEVRGVAAHEGNGASPEAATPAAPFNSCIVAAPNLAPLSVMRRLLPFLGPSTPFAVWMPWPQPLAECMQALRLEGSAVNMALHETWFREIQASACGRMRPYTSVMSSAWRQSPPLLEPQQGALGCLGSAPIHKPWGMMQFAACSMPPPPMHVLQVLPARTHPLMNMNHGGGFILAGTTVLRQ